jgi:hypothetical protein
MSRNWNQLQKDFNKKLGTLLLLWLVNVLSIKHAYWNSSILYNARHGTMQTSSYTQEAFFGPCISINLFHFTDTKSNKYVCIIIPILLKKKRERERQLEIQRFAEGCSHRGTI